LSSGKPSLTERMPLVPGVKMMSPRQASIETPIALKLMRGFFLGGLYIAVSSAMILFNKALMREDRFPFPIFLTATHMAGSLTMSLLIRSFAPSFFPSAPTVFNEPLLLDAGANFYRWDPLRLMQALAPFVPIAACGGMCLVTGNWAYKVATVSFLQMIKESHIVIVYILTLAFGLEQPTIRNAAVLLFVAASATLAVSAQAELSVRGLMLQMMAGLFGSLQIVLTNVMLARTGKGRIDPLTMVLCVAPLMLVGLVPATALTWEARIISRILEFRSCIAINVLLAFLLQITSALTIRYLSATGMSLASMAKDLGIVFAASKILGEQLSSLQVAGFVGSVLGISVYTGMKLFPGLFERPRAE